MNHTLKNQRALITGGSRGIGAAIESSVWPVKALMLPLINQFARSPNLAQTWRSAFDRTFLSPRTISKIVGREVGFDRRTLKQFTNYQLPITNYQLALFLF